MSPSSVGHANDDYASDGQSDVSPTPQQTITVAPVSGSPLAHSSQLSSDSDERDLQEREAARQSSEAAAIKKTGWLLLPSTARNLTNALTHAGVTGLQVLPVYNFAIPSQVRPLAFFLLYKWAPDRGDRVVWNPERMRNPDVHPANGLRTGVVEDDSASLHQRNVLFCGQTMDNAAATQALVLTLLNIAERGSRDNAETPLKNGSGSSPEEGLYYDIGDRMRVLKAFIRPMDPVVRAAAVCSSTVVREAHNNAARDQLDGHPDLLDEDGKVRTSLLADELWMYSAFVPMDDGSVLYEMEGMGDGAHILGNYSPGEGDKWVNTVFETLSERIAVFQQHNAQFLIFALTTEGNASSSAAYPPLAPKENSGRLDTGENSTRRGSASQRRKREDDSEEDDSSGEESNDSYDSDADSESDYDEETMREELERISATHNYEVFFVEMLKLMASRGDINSLIRGQDVSHDVRSMHE